jgi:hypothetical protein
MKLFVCLSVCLLWAAAPASAQNYYSPQPQVYSPQANPAPAPQVNPYYAGYAPVVYTNTAAQQPTPIAPASAHRQSGLGGIFNNSRTGHIITPPARSHAEENGFPESCDAPGGCDCDPEPLNYDDDGFGCADGSCGLKNWRRHFAGKGGWYGSIAGLYMTRDMPNRQAYAVEADDLDDVRLTNRSAEVDWEGGYEITFGRCLGRNTRIEVGYWEIDGMNGFAEAYPFGSDLISTYDFQGVELDGDDLAIFFDASNGQKLFRADRFRNIELNLYHRPCSIGAFGGDGGYGGCGACGCRWNVELLAGVRYFNFNEHLIWGSVDPGLNFGDNGGVNEAYIVSDVENHLLGFQIGALIDYYFTKRVSVFAKPKVGVYGNHTKVDFDIYRGDGEPGQSWFSGEYYPVHSTKNDVALLAELELGARWDINCHWSVFASYRALAMTGVALSDEQIPFYVVDMQAIRDIDTSNSLILHGATLGVQFAY